MPTSRLFRLAVVVLALHLPATLAQDVPSSSLLDNLSLFIGLDGAKTPQDLGVNAHMGGRGHFNWAYPLLEDHGIGVQAGGALVYQRNAVGVLETVNPTHDRTQFFFTAGVFQRTDWGLSWGVVFDYQYQDHYASISLSQWRGEVSYAVGDTDEFGVWGTVPNRRDHATVAGASFDLKPFMQANLFWRHVFDNQAVVRGWVGVAEEHSRFVLVFPPVSSATRHPFTYGADVNIPLSDSLTLFGQANFVTPHDSGVVTATLGIAFYPGGGARQAARNRFAPLLTVADNPTFPVDLLPR